MRALLTTLLVAAAIILAIFVIGSWSCDQPPKPHGETQKSEQSAAEHCSTSYGIFEIGLFDIGPFVHANHEEITAASTAIIAIFTIILGVFTVSVSNSTRATAVGFMSAERPHMIISELKVSGLNSPPADGKIPLTITFRITNFGRTPAFAKQMSLHLYFMDKLPRDLHQEVREINGVTAPDRWWGTEWPTTVEAPLDRIERVKSGEFGIFVYGCFKYEDIFERPHETGFAYSLDVERGSDASKHFSPAEAPSYWKYS